MQRTMSNNLCEVPMKRSIRGRTSIVPKKVGLPETDMVKSKLCEIESVYETSLMFGISKRRYGVQMEGNPQAANMWMKSSPPTYECLWLSEYKSCTSIEGVRDEKTRDQIHKDSCPELGCSGNLSLVVTVHPVNVGTLFSGLMTGLAAVDVENRGRNSRISLSGGKPRTWRRAVVSRQVPKEIGNEVGRGGKSSSGGIRYNGVKELPENNGTELKTGGKPCAVKVACTVWGRRRRKHAKQGDLPCEKLSLVYRLCASPSLPLTIVTERVCLCTRFWQVFRCANHTIRYRFKTPS